MERPTTNKERRKTLSVIRPTPFCVFRYLFPSWLQLHCEKRIRTRSPFVIVPLWALILVAVLSVTYLVIDPLPPRRFVIATGATGSSYDNFARRYQRILARYGVVLENRNTAGALDNLRLLRDTSSGVQAALTTFGTTCELPC